MRIVLILAAIASFGVGALGVSAIRSDIQIIIAAVGLIGGFVLMGLAGILDRLDQLAPGSSR